MIDPVGGSLAIAFLAFSIFGIWKLFICPYRAAKKKQAEAMARMDGSDSMQVPEEEDVLPPMLEECRATLVKKKCGTKMVGTRSVKCHVEYWLFFEDEFEREIPLLVEEEIYLAIEEGDSGILALSDGKLYSFTLDE